MNLTRLFLVIPCCLLFISCGNMSRVVSIDEETGYFPAWKNRKAIITASIKINPDTLKKLVVVYNSEYLKSITINMKYFREVMDFSELEKAFIANGCEVKGPLNLGSLDLYLDFIDTYPFTVLYMDSRKEENKSYAELKLYDPIRGEDIFASEIIFNEMLEGWTDKGTTYPLFNSLIDYLKEL